MVDSPYVPSRGDIVWLSFTPQIGYEQASRRPALVLSPKTYNEKSGLALFCPITSHIKGYPFEVRLPSTVPVTGVVLADQIRSLDWRGRHADYQCTASSQLVGEVVSKASALLA